MAKNRSRSNLIRKSEIFMQCVIPFCLFALVLLEDSILYSPIFVFSETSKVALANARATSLCY
jgi:hypothetical protein